jgi:antitoxin component YwqK of YwqJK toxin-antitoxin module
MSQERYELTQNELIIFDRELEIDIALEFYLPRLTVDLKGNGIVQERDPEDRLLSAYTIAEGRRHGECRLYGEEGNLRAEMFYLHGKLHGPSLMYSEKGQILARTWYREGKRIGKAQFYFPSGALSSLQRFKDGQWEGVQEYFYEDGSIKSLLPFSAGKLHGEVRLFWESDKPKRSANYIDGLRAGWDKLWNEQGIVIDEGEYKSGMPIGVHRHYFANGKLQEELHYHAPSRYDRKQWNEAGKLTFEGVFAPDLSYTEKVYLEPHGAKVRKGAWDGNRICWK